MLCKDDEKEEEEEEQEEERSDRQEPEHFNEAVVPGRSARPFFSSLCVPLVAKGSCSIYHPPALLGNCRERRGPPCSLRVGRPRGVRGIIDFPKLGWGARRKKTGGSRAAVMQAFPEARPKH